MSLAVPSILRAAAEAAPGRQLSLGGQRMRCAQLDRAAQDELLTGSA